MAAVHQKRGNKANKSKQYPTYNGYFQRNKPSRIYKSFIIKNINSIFGFFALLFIAFFYLRINLSAAACRLIQKFHIA